MATPEQYRNEFEALLKRAESDGVQFWADAEIDWQAETVDDVHLKFSSAAGGSSDVQLDLYYSREY